ncbi:MAG: BTAD domain-containing putative transcriptional regulator [Gemmatimonadota bacterium]
MAGTKRLGLFAYLASAPGRFQGRDRLLGLFWPASDEPHARNALRNLLHQLRQIVGDGVLVTRGDQGVGVAVERVWCDVAAFRAACAAEAWEEAVKLYQGPLLEGRYFSEAPEFEEWVETERTQLARAAAHAARSMVESARARGNDAEIITWARVGMNLEAFDETFVRDVMEGLARTGQSALALDEFAQFATRLRRGLDVEPSPDIRALADELRQAHGTAGPITSLAVLPLDNLTGDPGQQYFVDGMQQALIAELSKISTLKVISRTSTARYGGSKEPMPQVARELGVEGIIEGSVAREGEQVRITVQLIHGPTDAHIWADNYQRRLSGVLALQSEMARAVTEHVRASLAPRAEVAAASAVDPAGYDAYLRGIYHLSRFTAKDLDRAQAELQRAIQLDPLLARAHAGLAETFVWLGYLGYPGAPPYQEAFARASNSVTRALELDPSLPEAHLTLGKIRWMYRPDIVAAERAVARSLALSPSQAEAHTTHALLQALRGRHDAAIAAAERARELDPLASPRHAWLAWTYWIARRYDEAIRLAQEAIALDPTTTRSYQALGGAYVELGRFEEAVAAFQEGLERSGRDRIFLAHLGYVLARMDQTEEARRILAQLIQFCRAGFPSPYYVAWTYMGLGEGGSALTWLETTYDEGWGHIAFLVANPAWDPLRAEPRFQTLVRNVGLE